MANNKKQKYQFYACYKNSKGGGMFLNGRDNCSEAYKDLKGLESYIQNDIVFIGVVKCSDGNPLKHISNF